MTSEFKKHIATPIDLLNSFAAIQKVIADLQAVEIKKEDFPVIAPHEQITLLSQKRDLILKQQQLLVDEAKTNLARADDEVRVQFEAALEEAVLKQSAAQKNAEKDLSKSISAAIAKATKEAEDNYKAAQEARNEALEKAQLKFAELEEKLKEFGDQQMTAEEIAEFQANESKNLSETFARETNRVLETRRAFYIREVDPLVMEAQRLPEGEVKADLLARANEKAAEIKQANPKPQAADFNKEEGGTR